MAYRFARPSTNNPNHLPSLSSYCARRIHPLIYFPEKLRRVKRFHFPSSGLSPGSVLISSRSPSRKKRVKVEGVFSKVAGERVPTLGNFSFARCLPVLLKGEIDSPRRCKLEIFGSVCEGCGGWSTRRSTENCHVY